MKHKNITFVMIAILMASLIVSGIWAIKESKWRKVEEKHCSPTEKVVHWIHSEDGSHRFCTMVYEMDWDPDTDMPGNYIWRKVDCGGENLMEICE